LGPKFNTRKDRNKKSAKCEAKPGLDPVSQSMLFNYPNQIINLKAPAQFKNEGNK